MHSKLQVQAASTFEDHCMCRSNAVVVYVRQVLKLKADRE
jgi:hypothetical protein